MSLLSATDLSCLRGDRLVFEGLSMSLDVGEGLLLTGPNGSGKSSFLRVLAGLLEPFDGMIQIHGRDPYADRSVSREHVAYIGHADPIKRTLTVEETLRFWAGLMDDPKAATARIPDILASLDIAHLAKAPGAILSSGQKRRVSLARLLLSNATLWLMDEPTVGLDTVSVARIEEIVAAHRAQGGAVILSTHVAFSLPGGTNLDMGDFTPDWGRDAPSQMAGGVA